MNLYLYTKDQTQRLFGAWECKEPLPKAKQCVWISFSPGNNFRLAKVTDSGRKATYGGKLYAVEFMQEAPLALS